MAKRKSSKKKQPQVGNELYPAGNLIAEGKTKQIYEVQGDPTAGIFVAKDDITKNDDASQTQIMEGKAALATNTTCRVFELLKEADIPVAYHDQISPTSFVADRCTMINLELIARRYGTGSFLKRVPACPDMHRFNNLLFEAFLKTTGGALVENGTIVLEDLPCDDPFIPDPYEQVWNIAWPKKPDTLLEKGVVSRTVLRGKEMNEIEALVRRVFLVLEGAWKTLGYHLIDFKIELGLNHYGELVVADVIDNDSWRLRTDGWQELSKQLFRDNADMSVITDKYRIVSDLVKNFRIPRQAIIFWRGSESDELPKLNLPGCIRVEEIVASGHKSPRSAMRHLGEINRKYPQGGVIIPIVGKSNGLGPILSANCSWPVISYSPTAKGNPNDVWSSLSMPSNVPHLFCEKVENAVLAALNILATSNPVAYAERQLRIESQDSEANCIPL